jgi:hypothetical protein
MKLYTWLILHSSTAIGITGIHARTAGVGEPAENLIEDMKRVYFSSRKQYSRETVRQNLSAHTLGHSSGIGALE